MDFDEIRQLISANGEKVIFIENGKPSIVLMSFGAYQKRFDFKGEEKKDISKKKDDLKVEDLPF